MTVTFRLAAPIILAASLNPAADSRQATGVKVGEVTPHSAIVWMRLTERPARNPEGAELIGRPTTDDPTPTDDEVPTLRHASPGAPGRVRLRFGTDPDLGDARSTAWAEVDASTDFAHQFRLDGLEPGTAYHYAAETTGPGGNPEHAPLIGRFRTAPLPDEPAPVTFTVVTGMMAMDLDHPDGFTIFESMGRLDPEFLVPTGDTVYYDNERPRAKTVSLARYHWQRMYGCPRHIEFHRNVPAYWEKDDHDTLSDDCWPGMDPEFMLPMTFADGLRLFREQVPMGDGPTYRTYRWGKDLQVWLVEGRDFRTPNPEPDGPDKSIWGAEQKAWLKRTMLESDATWKVLVSPTPIVGPDRARKRDNHANEAFATEGREIRAWLAENLPENAFIACGDRHWQYHSIDPASGVHEFSCGPASDEHAGGSPGFEPEYHRFHRMLGGFLSVAVDRAEGVPTIAFRLHDVDGAVQHEYVRTINE
jgi:alkaline phosphatase D